MCSWQRSTKNRERVTVDVLKITPDAPRSSPYACSLFLLYSDADLSVLVEHVPRRTLSHATPTKANTEIDVRALNINNKSR